MLEILNSTRLSVDEKLILKAVKLTFFYLKKDKELSLNIVLVGRKKMRELNRAYRGIDGASDVLSFESGGKFPVFQNNAKFIGEVFVCPEIVMQNSKKIGSSFKKELIHVIIHGTLHLLGCDHEGSEKKRLEMHAIEEEIMDSFLAS